MADDDVIAMQDSPVATGDRTWHVLWTRSHCEELVAGQLVAKGFEVFLPRLDAWSRRAGRNHLVRVPMFPGYLFLSHALDKESYIEVRKVRGLASILGERWDRPAVVPPTEVEAIRRIVEAGLRAMPHPYLKTGQWVRITHGVLAGLEGILDRIQAERGLLILSVEILRRSVAVEVDCTSVTPIGGPPRPAASAARPAVAAPGLGWAAA